MRVLFLTHNYPRHGGDVPGAFLHPLARALIDQGVDLQVIAPSDRGQGGEDLLDGVPVRRVRYAVSSRETLAYTGNLATEVRTIGGLRAFIGMLEAFRREVRRELIEHPGTVVHAHWWVPAGVSLAGRTPTVITCHGSDVRLLDNSFIARFLGQRVLRRASMVSTVSPELARIIERRVGVTIPDDQVQPMPIEPIERPRSSGGGGVVILGRLSAQKRVDLAIDAYAAALGQGLDLPLTIAGDGSERASLESLVQQLRIADRVRFLGAITPDTVPGVLATADLMLMPAQGEGFGLAAAEALIQGVPVVGCADGGGLLDVIPEGNGGRIVPPNPQAIADAIIALTSDPNAPQDALRSGVAWNERLSPRHVAARCIHWYERVLAA
jgi:glycosyltransferase involved in cell wall biosynthesis